MIQVGQEAIGFRGKANSSTTALAFGEMVVDSVVQVYDYGVSKIIEAALGEDVNELDQVDGDDDKANEEQEDADQERDE